MSARAGIVVTGTEVLTGRVVDRNGPWLADRLRETGIDLETIVIVGDRPSDIESALRWMASENVDLIVTTGGLGPTADDLTAAVVGAFQGREMVMDEALRGRIAKILEGIAKRWPGIDLEAIEHGNRKQATIPAGSTILDPVGTAPGLVVPPGAGTGPTVVVLPGPPRELQPMWADAAGTPAFADAAAGRTEYRQEMLRLFGIPESEIAETLRRAHGAGVALDELEVTTCLRRGEVEIVTRFEPPAQATYDALAALVRSRHADTLFSDDGSSVDAQIAALLSGPGAVSSVAVAESCTGGLVTGRLTDLPGSSRYLRGGLVVYSNEAKTQLAGIAPEVIERHGAVSVEVARGLADGAIERLGSDCGIGITGVAGPDGGSEEKPVGTVWFSVALAGGERIDRKAHLPGSRADVRDRATTVALHLLRRLLLGLGDLER